MPEGGTVTVCSHRIGCAGAPTHAIEITDTGAGIPSDQLERIFDVSFARDSTVKMGFGLATSQSIVEEHGGQIAIDSQVGQGTAVTVRLPHRHSDSA